MEALKVRGLSDKGKVRQNNEDYFGWYVPKDTGLEHFGSLFAVSDGVGGASAGEVASAEAVNVLLQEYYFGDLTDKIPERLKSAFQKTSLHIFDLSLSHNSARNMKCTLSTLLLNRDRFFISHVGDSKILLLRDNELIQLTKDHSLVGKLMRLGLISAEEARTHPNKNVLLKAVGDGPLLVADFYSGLTRPGDLFCMVTDGIVEHATHEELQSFLVEKGSSDVGLVELVAELNRRGGHDNMTILTVTVNKV
ncbi:MAG: protein phosphatase 2C domain-containing protein [Syntrophobacteraceae bacterium]|nr:protein phosphatase 2C domain-containing protein [Syntrophobacteraceae bacterium]